MAMLAPGGIGLPRHTIRVHVDELSIVRVTLPTRVLRHVGDDPGMAAVNPGHGSREGLEVVAEGHGQPAEH